jgi:hypothetical protein
LPALPRVAGQLGVLEAGPHDTLHVEIIKLLPNLQEYEREGPVWIRQRTVPLSQEQSARLTAFALGASGKWFAVLRIVVQVTPFRTRGPESERTSSAARRTWTGEGPQDSGLQGRSRWQSIRDPVQRVSAANPPPLNFDIRCSHAHVSTFHCYFGLRRNREGTVESATECLNRGRFRTAWTIFFQSKTLSSHFSADFRIAGRRLTSLPPGTHVAITRIHVLQVENGFS